MKYTHALFWAALTFGLGYSGISGEALAQGARAAIARDGSWSHDGSLIAFTSNRQGNFEIYTMDANGGNLRQVTHSNAKNELRPQFSPDNSQIVCYTWGNEETDILIFDVDGSNLRRVAQNGVDPDWSPDGKQIAFGSERDGNSEIYVMDADGSNQVRLTKNSFEDSVPMWSPDGSQLLFISKRDGNAELYVMNADGTSQRRVTNHPYQDRVAGWSPDGLQFVFYSRPHTGEGATREEMRDAWRMAEIEIVDVDGSNRRKITNDAFRDQGPVFSPNGKEIMFASNRDGALELYVMEVDGGNVRRLTNSQRISE